MCEVHTPRDFVGFSLFCRARRPVTGEFIRQSPTDDWLILAERIDNTVTSRILRRGAHATARDSFSARRPSRREDNGTRGARERASSVLFDALII